MLSRVLGSLLTLVVALCFSTPVSAGVISTSFYFYSDLYDSPGLRVNNFTVDGFKSFGNLGTLTMVVITATVGAEASLSASNESDDYAAAYFDSQVTFTSGALYLASSRRTAVLFLDSWDSGDSSDVDVNPGDMVFTTAGELRAFNQVFVPVKRWWLTDYTEHGGPLFASFYADTYYAGSIDYYYTQAATPEPAAVGLTLTGLALFAVRYRYRKL